MTAAATALGSSPILSTLRCDHVSQVDCRFAPSLMQRTKRTTWLVALPIAIGILAVLAWPTIRDGRTPSSPNVGITPESSTQGMRSPRSAEHRLPIARAADESSTGLRIIDAETGAPIEGATALWLDDAEERLISDTSGTLTIPDAALGRHCVLVHSDYALTRFQLRKNVRTLSMKRRPMVRCVLEGLSAPEILGLRFSVTFLGSESQLIQDLPEDLKSDFARTTPWNGLGSLDVRLAHWGGFHVLAEAMDPGSAEALATVSDEIDVQTPSTIHRIRFDPATVVSRVDVQVEAFFDSPLEVEISHWIRGPFSGPDAPAMSGCRRLVEFGQQPNETASTSLIGVAPGHYEWGVDTAGYGTYSLQRIRIDHGTRRIELRNPRGSMTSMRMEVAEPPGEEPVDLRILSALELVRGRVIPKDEFVDGRFTWEGTLPTTEPLWAIAYQGRSLCAGPVRIDNRGPGGFSELLEWREQGTLSISIDLPADYPDIVWVRIHHLASGYARLGAGHSTSIHGSPTYPPGQYEVSLEWNDGASPAQTVTVEPGERSSVRLVR